MSQDPVTHIRASQIRAGVDTVIGLSCFSEKLGAPYSQWTIWASPGRLSSNTYRCATLTNQRVQNVGQAGPNQGC
jgi:hypothetical protein